MKYSTDLRDSVPLHLRLIWIIGYNQQFPFYSYVLQDKAEQIEFFFFLHPQCTRKRIENVTSCVLN